MTWLHFTCTFLLIILSKMLVCNTLLITRGSYTHRILKVMAKYYNSNVSTSLKLPLLNAQVEAKALGI